MSGRLVRILKVLGVLPEVAPPQDDSISAQVERLRHPVSIPRTAEQPFDFKAHAARNKEAAERRAINREYEERKRKREERKLRRRYGKVILLAEQFYDWATRHQIAPQENLSPLGRGWIIYSRFKDSKEIGGYSTDPDQRIPDSMYRDVRKVIFMGITTQGRIVAGHTVEYGRWIDHDGHPVNDRYVSRNSVQTYRSCERLKLQNAGLLGDPYRCCSNTRQQISVIVAATEYDWD